MIGLRPQTHAEILAEERVISCLGKLDGYAIYVAKYNYMPPENGVTIRAPEITAEIWTKVIEDMKRPSRKSHDSIFLAESQAKSFLKWAGDLIEPWFDASQAKPCEDCTDGWYVGVVDRYPCPTCNGTRRVSV